MPDRNGICPGPLDEELLEALDPCALTKEQIGHLYGCAAKVICVKTDLDNQFVLRLREIASTFPPAIASGFNAQVDAWVAVVNKLNESHVRAIRAVVDLPAGVANAGETLQ